MRAHVVPAARGRLPRARRRARACSAGVGRACGAWRLGAAQLSACLGAFKVDARVAETEAKAHEDRKRGGGDDERDAAYHRLFVDLAEAEHAAAEKRLERQRNDVKRQRDAIERRLERRRSTSKPAPVDADAKPLPISSTTQQLARLKFKPKPPLPDIVSQIEQAREANVVAHQLHSKRQHRHLNVKPARPPPVAPLWVPPRDHALAHANAPVRTSVRQGMGFSSTPCSTPKAPKTAEAKGGWG